MDEQWRLDAYHDMEQQGPRQSKRGQEQPVSAERLQRAEVAVRYLQRLELDVRQVATLKYWVNGEPRVLGTTGRVLKVEVIGQTELLPDSSDRGPSAEGSGLARALPAGSVGGSRRIGA